MNILFYFFICANGAYWCLSTVLFDVFRCIKQTPEIFAG